MSLTWAPPGTQTVYTEVSGTITFTDDDISAVYVDWDDGPSNKKSEANFQWYTTTEPETEITLTHTYTATGQYAPIVQVINDKGMASKYHRYSATTEVTPSVVDTAIGLINIADGTSTGLLRTENRTVLSGIDNGIFEKSGSRDLYVALAPTVPISSLDTIVSGSGLQLTVRVLVEDYVDPTVSLLTGDTLTSVRDLSVKIPETTWSGSLGGLKMNDSTFLVKKVLKATLDTCKPVLSGDTATTNNDLNKLKAFFFTSGAANFFYPITYVSFGCPVKKLDDSDRQVLMDFTQSRAKASNTIISEYFFDLGKSWINPQDIWAVNPFSPDSDFDFGTASTFTSGTATTDTIKKVRYTFTPRPDGLISAATGAIDSPDDRYQQAFNLSAVTGCSCWYFEDVASYDRADQFLIDDFGRIADQYHLLRMQAEPNSSADYRSELEGFAGVYRLSPPPDWGASGGAADHTADAGSAGPTAVAGAPQLLTSGGSAAKFYQDLAGKSKFTDSLTSGSYINCTAIGQASGTNNMELLSGANVDMIDYATGTTAGFNYTNLTGGAREAHEYLVAINSRKTNKIFFEATPLAKTFTSLAGTASGNSTQILGVYYLKVNNKGTFTQTCEWMPLEFEDTTKVQQEFRNTTSGTYDTRSASLAKSGYITFDMPDDWSSISMSGLTGGQGLGVSENPSMISITGTSPVDPRYEIELTGLKVAATGGVFGAGRYGRSITITGAHIGTQLSGTYSGDDIGVYKTLAVIISSSASNWVSGTTEMAPSNAFTVTGNQAGYGFWVASGGANGYDGGDSLTLQVGQGNNQGATWNSGNQENYAFTAPTKHGPFMNYGMWNTGDDVVMKIRNVGIYDVFDGASKIWVALTGSDYSSIYTTVDATDNLPFPNTYGFENISNEVLLDASGTWNDTEYYPLKFVLSGTDWTKFYHQSNYYSRGILINSSVSGSMQKSGVELWNILPADNAFSQIIKEVDDSAFNLSRLPVTSDVSYARTGNFYEVITIKGKVTVVKTGIGIQEMSFASVALGDSSDASAFTKFGYEGSLYNYLHKIRRIEEETVPVFWDERQKDGTYVRFWGIVKNVNETHGEGGPRSLQSFDFTMVVQKIALIDSTGILMADPIPLGGIQDARDFA